MDRDPPEPQPFDPAQSSAPPLPDPPTGGGLVLVVAASGADDRDWAERSTTALASGWAKRGRRVLLADLALVSPGLHRVLGIENREGVSDTFLFGSSILRVARPVRVGGFLFVPAGTATARPEAVTGSPRWSAVVDGCARVRATLVVYLPSDLPGGENLLERASDVVLLTDASAVGSASLQAGLGDRLRAVLMPPDGAGLAFAPEAEESLGEGFAGDEQESDPGAPEALPPEPADILPAFEPAADELPEPPVNPLSGLDMDFALVTEPEEEPAMEGSGNLAEGAPELALAPEPEANSQLPLAPSYAPPPRPVPDRADDFGRSGLALAMLDGPSDRVAAEDARAQPPAAPTSRSASSSRPAPKAPERHGETSAAAARTRVLVLILLLVIAGVLAAAWYGVVEIPWLSPWLSSASASIAPTPSAGEASAAPARPTLSGPPMSMALESFTDPALARLQASSLNEQHSDLLFVIAPVRLDGQVYHRLLAGPASDSADAARLRATLASLLTREDQSTWALRPTPLAFHLGDRVQLDEARLRVEELSRVDIPAYVLELPARPNAGATTPCYRVYEGAYSGEEEAMYFRDLLASNGFPDARLIERTGRHPE